MPTYQYACTDADCGHEFELVQSFTDPAASECPVCGHRVRKVYGSVGVVFKGSGFYRTDSRADSRGEKTSEATKKESAKEPAAASSSSPAPASTSSPSGSSGSSGSGGSGSGSGGAAKAAASA